MKCQAQWPAKLPCKIALVGEAPGAEEEAKGIPFVGTSGRLLDHMLKGAEISRQECLVTNVFTERPRGNNVTLFFEKKLQAKASGNVSDLPSYGALILKKEWRGEIDRLRAELIKAQPNVIVALGVTALWALSGLSKLEASRGVIMPATLVARKMIATYHPAAILREFNYRPIAIADFIKARKDSEFTEIRRVRRTIWLAEKLGDIDLFLAEVKDCIAFDVETSGREVTHISLASSPTRALVIPFVDASDNSVWSEEDERAIWLKLYGVMANPSIRKVAHNSIYDLTYMHHHGMLVRGEVEDTMLLHHSMQPELRKSLGVLASLYLSESAFKKLRVKAAYKVGKADE